ncbi:hypothetical protein QJQ45_026005 [Haematococcus lacustris]|nr:hypothetical protein QJQ45_026005 [Haematococcus lacustris]
MADAAIAILVDPQEMRTWSRNQKREGKRVALVPTMGYLHDGHLSLVKAARELADVVVASIYVNPTQFAAHEDFDVYPRQPEEDRRKLASAGCLAVFEPRSLYHSGRAGRQAGRRAGRQASRQAGRQCRREVTAAMWWAGSSSTLTATRPGWRWSGCSNRCVAPHAHTTSEACARFRCIQQAQGTADPDQVVTKLFHIVEPDVAVFGQKDYQQLRIIKRMVRELDFPVQVVGQAICREADGLAMSSRNARLSSTARQAALCINEGLRWVSAAHAERSLQQPQDIQQRLINSIQAAGGTVDYVQVVDADHLEAVTDLYRRPVLVAVAAHFPARDRGSVRLLDNVVLSSGS